MAKDIAEKIGNDIYGPISETVGVSGVLEN
jgi:hypothetical protein